jgi:hypothetical protein
LPVPSGRKPSEGRSPGRGLSSRPLTISKEVPSPPTAMKWRRPAASLVAGAHAGVAGGLRLDDVDLEAGLAQAVDRGGGPLAARAAARGGVDDGEEAGGEVMSCDAL